MRSLRCEEFGADEKRQACPHEPTRKRGERTADEISGCSVNASAYRRSDTRQNDYDHRLPERRSVVLDVFVSCGSQFSRPNDPLAESCHYFFLLFLAPRTDFTKACSSVSVGFLLA